MNRLINILVKCPSCNSAYKIDIIKIFAGLDGNGSLHYVHGKDKKGREIASDYASWNDSAYNPDNFDDGDDTEYDSWG